MKKLLFLFYIICSSFSLTREESDFEIWFNTLSPERQIELYKLCSSDCQNYILVEGRECFFKIHYDSNEDTDLTQKMLNCVRARRTVIEKISNIGGISLFSVFLNN